MKKYFLLFTAILKICFAEQAIRSYEFTAKPHSYLTFFLEEARPDGSSEYTYMRTLRLPKQQDQCHLHLNQVTYQKVGDINWITFPFSFQYGIPIESLTDPNAKATQFFENGIFFFYGIKKISPNQKQEKIAISDQIITLNPNQQGTCTSTITEKPNPIILHVFAFDNTKELPKVKLPESIKHRISSAFEISEIAPPKKVTQAMLEIREMKRRNIKELQERKQQAEQLQRQKDEEALKHEE